MSHLTEQQERQAAGRLSAQYLRSVGCWGSATSGACSPLLNTLLLPGDEEKNGLVLENEEWQGYFPHMFWPEHFRALLLFGSDMLYRFATVPELANSEGRQPVVFLDPYEEIHALPIASDVNRFFDTYSRYVEIMVEDPDYQAGGAPGVGFPYGVPELIARDTPLLGMIKEGRFDRLMYERNKTGWRDESAIANTREWINRLVR